ncbi:MAG: response regulator [Rubripirellula sp.]
MLKILIIDDHEVARIGVTRLLESEEFTIVGAAESGDRALELLGGDLSVDAVVMDIRMPGTDGLVTLSRIKELRPTLPVILLTAYENPTYVARAAALGAADYVLKGVGFASIRESLQRATAGDNLLPHSPIALVRRVMRENVDTSKLPDGFPLTAREAQVLRHIALGLNNKEIARSLGISVETVKEHVQNILRKLKANDRTDAAVRAIKSGIVS